MNNEEYLKQFLNAESAYDKYKIIKILLDWLDTKDGLLEAKDAEIIRLRDSVPGYALSDYVEEYNNHNYGHASLSGKLECLDELIGHCRKQQVISNENKHDWLVREDTLQLIKQDLIACNATNNSKS